VGAGAIAASMHSTLDVAGRAVSLPGLVVLGIVVGFVAGMFGVGGGVLLTPLLTVVFGVPLEIAAASGLCQMVGTALATALRHRRLAQGEPRFDLLMLGGSVLGVEAGTRVLARLARSGTLQLNGRAVPTVSLVVEPTYGVLLLGIAALFWSSGRGSRSVEYVREGPLARARLGPTVDLPRVPLRGVSAVLVAEIGLMLGFLSGLLGIGGGVALMPLLIYGFGFPMRQAAGTGVIVLLATAVTGTVAHAARGNVHLGLAMVLLVGASVSAQLGALATHALPVAALRRAFAGFVLVTVAAIGWDLYRRVLG
jgi:uncharacterized membrane protein YfcA